MIIDKDRGYVIRGLFDGGIVQVECIRNTGESGKNIHRMQKYKTGVNTKGIYFRKGNKKIYITEEIKVFMKQFEYDKELFKKLKKESWI